MNFKKLLSRLTPAASWTGSSTSWDGAGPPASGHLRRQPLEPFASRQELPGDLPQTPDFGPGAPGDHLLVQKSKHRTGLILVIQAGYGYRRLPALGGLRTDAHFHLFGLGIRNACHFEYLAVPDGAQQSQAAVVEGA